MATSIRAAKNLEKGSVLNMDDIVFKAPDDGLPPYEIENVIGKKINTSIQEEENIKFKHFD